MHKMRVQEILGNISVMIMKLICINNTKKKIKKRLNGIYGKAKVRDELNKSKFRKLFRFEYLNIFHSLSYSVFCRIHFKIHIKLYYRGLKSQVANYFRVFVRSVRFTFKKIPFMF